MQSRNGYNRENRDINDGYLAVFAFTAILSTTAVFTNTAILTTIIQWIEGIDGIQWIIQWIEGIEGIERI